MNIELITKPLQLELFGCGGVATNKDYVGTVFKLSDKMWTIVKSNGIKNKGKNIWVYDRNDTVFAGVELEEGIDGAGYGLEAKKLTLTKYAYYKHVGPYQLIKQVTQNIKDESVRQGFEVTLPHIEIYGHWTADETKLETELLMSLK